ncbi:hypothetical protein K1719_001007 [Acacia pycnantha]|nr:hypothetical protein K1719_001007 [Acacia pycnantha]
MANLTDDDLDHTLDEYMAEESPTYQFSIQFPTITARSFKLKPIMLQIVDLCLGNHDEDPIAHLTCFVQVCENFKFQGVTLDALRLRLFPLSLDKKART